MLDMVNRTPLGLDEELTLKVVLNAFEILAHSLQRSVDMFKNLLKLFVPVVGLA